jgi:hypothetical protein
MARHHAAVFSFDHLRRFCKNSSNDLFLSDNSAQEPSKYVRSTSDAKLSPEKIPVWMMRRLIAIQTSIFAVGLIGGFCSGLKDFL